MNRIVTIDVDTHPRLDGLDCLAYIDGQTYRLRRTDTDITRKFVAETLRVFADYIDNSAVIKDDEVEYDRNDVHKWYREGRLK